MTCEICGKGPCTGSFHSLEEQKRHDDRQTIGADVEELRDALQSADEAVADLQERLAEVEIERDRVWAKYKRLRREFSEWRQTHDDGCGQ